MGKGQPDEVEAEDRVENQNLSGEGPELRLRQTGSFWRMS